MQSIKDITAFPLSWPDGWVRTKAVNRDRNRSWKNSFGVYRQELVDEVRRLGAFEMVLSTNIPINKTNGLPREGFTPVDPGVACYFTLKAKQDFSWQDVLGIEQMPVTRDQIIELIHRRFRIQSLQCHPESQRPDIELFHRLNQAKQAGLDYANGRSREPRPTVIACDKFSEVRLNFHAIGLTVNSLRQIERCGSSTLLERAFRGFQAALPAGPGGEAA